MRRLLVVPHLGMGDYLICHGAIRAIAERSKKYDEVYLIIKSCYEKNIRFMFRDLTKIRYVIVDSNTAVEDHSKIIESFDGDKIVAWWYNYNSSDHTTEEHIYLSLDLPPDCRYNDFKIQRDTDRENQVYTEVIGNLYKPYAFVADDPSRGYIIDITKVDGFQDMHIIKSSDLLKYSMFDLLKVIEKAQGVHVMYSAFFILIDCMSLNKIYLHNSYLNKVLPIESYGKPMQRFLKTRNISVI